MLTTGRRFRAQPSGTSLRWLAGKRRAVRCLTCRVTTVADGVVAASLPGRLPFLHREAVLYRCPKCKAGTFQLPRQADYSATPRGADAALAFYLQQGAGLWSIASNLLNVRRPRGCRLLEIGCGFGLGLDFARRALGWNVQGFDPSPFAVIGREQLSLPIHTRLFEPSADMQGAFDVVLASELLEHVSDPLALVEALHTVLAPGGVLALTTPDMDSARPDTPIGSLIPLLSAGYHTALQTADSLSRLLRTAGFAHVEVEKSGTTLVARAYVDRSVSPRSTIPDRSIYRRYLEDAMLAVPSGCDLWFGFASRAYREAVAFSDFAAAARLWPLLNSACIERYGWPLDTPAMPRGSHQLEALVHLEPLCLGSLLLHRGLHLLGEGASRAMVSTFFEEADTASARLRAALQAIGTDDADAEEISWSSRAESALCEASCGSDSALKRLAELGPAPIGHDRLERLQQRVFVELVNAGAYEAAFTIADSVLKKIEEGLAGSMLIGDNELDVLFCGGNLELLRSGGDGELALFRLRAARQRCERALFSGSPSRGAVQLLWPLLEAECLALRVLGRDDEQAPLVKSAVQRMQTASAAPAPPPSLTSMASENV